MGATNASHSIATPGASTRSLTAMVRERLEKMIIGGEVKGGERLNENALAADLGISRGPVREATRLLAEAGMVTIVPKRGVFVREISLEDVLHVYDVRTGLARVAGRLAAVRATSAHIAALRSLWEAMEEARATEESDRYYDINREFHSLTVAISGNRRLIDFHETTEREVFLFLRRGVQGRSRLDRSNAQHKEILEAIAAGDEQAAAESFERHVATGKQRMLDSLGGPLR